MRYGEVKRGRFLARPNRFVAHVELEGERVVCHVKNTGRCRELLTSGAAVYLERAENPARKTPYDLIAVEKGDLLINMDAQAPNKVFAQWMEAGHGEALGLPRPTLLRPEKTWGHSRFDFYWELSEAGCDRQGFVEVKGCTLEENGLALFPDAPTQRGVKHLRELMACRAAGYEAAVCVVIQMAGMTAFSPNDRTHPEFGAALREAAAAGVKVLAVECAAEPRSLTMTSPVPVDLSRREP